MQLLKNVLFCYSYQAAADSGTDFKLFISFDMTYVVELCRLLTPTLTLTLKVYSLADLLTMLKL